MSCASYTVAVHHYAGFLIGSYAPCGPPAAVAKQKHAQHPPPGVFSHLSLFSRLIMIHMVPHCAMYSGSITQGISFTKVMAPVMW